MGWEIETLISKEKMYVTYHWIKLNLKKKLINNSLTFYIQSQNSKNFKDQLDKWK